MEAIISKHLAELLLTILVGLASYVVRLHTTYMKKHEKAHERLEELCGQSELRLTRIEARVDHAENNINHMRHDLRNIREVA